MRGLISKVDACVCYVDKISNTFLIINQHFEISLENMIWSEDRQAATFVNCFDKL